MARSVSVSMEFELSPAVNRLDPGLATRRRTEILVAGPKSEDI